MKTFIVIWTLIFIPFLAFAQNHTVHKDSIEALRKIRLQKAQEKKDSIAQANRAKRKLEKEYIRHKQERQKARDSIALESKKAAAARKAYLEELKRQKKDKKKSDTAIVEKVKKKDSISVTTKDHLEAGSYYKTEDTFYAPPVSSSYLSFQFGPSMYMGDLGGNSELKKPLFGDLNFRRRTYFYGFAYTYLRKETYGIRFSYIFGDLAASDNDTYFINTKDPSYYRYVRNLDFKTKINELSLMGELYPLKLFHFSSKYHQSSFQPYILGGVAYYNFNPMGSIYDDIAQDYIWIELQPLHLEGQGMKEYPERKPYSRNQINIPYGLGIRYDINKSVSLGLEYTGRVLFTDYLDDVSTRYIDPALFYQYLEYENAQLAESLANKSENIDASRVYHPGDIRGNDQKNDHYFSLNAKLTIRLNRMKKSHTKK